MLRALVLQLTQEAPRGAWTTLRSEVRRYVVARVAPADVDDVVQEVLVAIASAEPGRARSLGAFAHGVAKRTVAEHHRRRAREHARLARLAVEPSEEHGEPLSSVETRLARALATFLADVTPIHAQAVRTVDVEGRKQADVARELGVPLSTLRARVQRGRQELRALVRRCCDVETDVRGRVLACEPRAQSCSC